MDYPSGRPFFDNMKKNLLIVALVAIVAYLAINQAGQSGNAVSPSLAKKQAKTVTFKKGSELVFDVTPRVSFGDSTTTPSK